MAVRKSCEIQRDLLTGMAYHRGTTLVAQRTYTYDILGRPSARNTARQGAIVNDSFTHNTRSELVEAQVNGKDYEYAYDNVGNRTVALEESSSEASSTEYTANALNQYTSISENGDSAFVPQFDADGNQTKIKTSTGIWSVCYNAENRPVCFTNVESNAVVECAYDSMGRRVYKKVTTNGTVTLHQRFIYRDFLQIACIDITRSNHPALWYISWDPVKSVVTRPLAIQINGTWYTYGWDITKNVCELYSSSGAIATSYMYSPFGKVTCSGNITQPIQWSSEFVDKELGLTYYNFRHFNSVDGRWLNRDKLQKLYNPNLYLFNNNNSIKFVDILGNVACDQIERRQETGLRIPTMSSRCRSKVLVFIGGFRDHEHGNMAYTASKLCKQHKNKYDFAYYYENHDSSDIAKSIAKYKCKCPNSNIVVIGHSYGGDTAMDVAEDLDDWNDINKKNVSIDLITLDPVSSFDPHNYNPFSRPESIDNWSNYFIEKTNLEHLILVPLIENVMAAFYTFLFYERSFEFAPDTIATLGGKWGWENQADKNKPFELGGETNHTNTEKMLEDFIKTL